MKGRMIFTLAVVSLAMIVSAADGSAAKKGPTEKWDFGYVPQKSEISHVFYLRNTGEKPLNVTNIKADCSCTSVSQLDHPVAPGDSAGITVTFKSGRYHYRIQKTTLVDTDDPETPKRRFSILARVYADEDTTGFIRASRPRLTWKVKFGQQVIQPDTVIFTNNSPDSVRVEVLDYPDALIDWTLSEVMIGPRGTTRLAVTPRKEVGERNVPDASVTVKFEKVRKTIVTIPLEFNY